MFEGKFKGQDLAIFLLATILGIFFIAAGWSKVMSPEKHVESFVLWGYPEWFVYFVGVIEIGAAVFLFVSRLRLFGVAVLGITMLAAALTHYQAGEVSAVPVPLILLGLVGVLGFFGRRRPGQ